MNFDLQSLRKHVSEVILMQNHDVFLVGCSDCSCFNMGDFGEVGENYINLG